MKHNRKERLRLVATGVPRKHPAQPRARREKSNLAWFAAALLLIGCTATATYHYTRRLLDATNQVVRSYNVASELGMLAAQTEQAESCRSDYALHQDGPQLRCFEDALESLPTQLAKLRQLAFNDAAEQKNLDDLDSLVRGRMEALQASVLLQKSHGYRPDEQLSVMQSGVGFREQMRARIGSLQSQEQHMVADGLFTSQKAALRAVVMLVSGTVLSAAILGFVFLKFQREIGKRVSAQYFMRLAFAALEFAHRHLEGIIESTPDSIGAVDHQLNFIAANGKYRSECQARYGCNPEVGSNLEAVFVGCAETLAESTKLWRRALADEAFTVTEEFSTAGREAKVFEVCYFPIKDRSQAPIAACRIARDITERKRFENLLCHQSQELTRSNAELEQFAYVASHDLQEPLRMVSSYVQLLAERYQGQLDAKADKFIAYAVDGAQRMQELINDLLALSRVKSRQADFKPVNSADVLQRVLHDLKGAVEKSQAVVEHSNLPTVTADEGQLYQLFQNLIGNALKFHGEQPPRIKVQAEQQGEQWLFTVQDNGIGIAPEHFERIFVLFQRLHSRQQYSGTGIGLAICKKIVERHRGRIWVESEAGRGAAFKFTLPISQEAATSPCWQQAGAHA